MANDINKVISANPIKNGTVVVSCKRTGLSSKDLLNTSVKNTPILTDIEAKFDNRFDDPAYYYGIGNTYPTSIEGKNATLAITDSTLTLISNSNKSIRITSLYISNVDGVNSAAVTVDIYNGSVARYLAKTIAVPADSTLTIIGGDDVLYLNIGDSLRVSASANNILEAIVSYEEIS